MLQYRTYGRHKFKFQPQSLIKMVASCIDKDCSLRLKLKVDFPFPFTLLLLSKHQANNIEFASVI